MPRAGGTAACAMPVAKLLVASALFLASVPVMAQGASVSVKPDRRSLSVGETLNVRIVIEGRPDSVRGPSIPDFDVVSKSSGTSISIINNQVKQERTTTLTLSPRKPGRLLIGKVEVVIAGNVAAASKPIAIQVGGKAAPRASPPSSKRRAPGTTIGRVPRAPVPGAAQPAPAPEPGDVRRFIGKQAFLLARAPERTLYFGEPVYVEYVLYVREDVPLQGVRPESLPDFKGFVVEQPPESQDNGRLVRLHGRRFREYVQWRGTVSALHAGTAELSPMTVVLFVGDFFSQRQYKVTSDPVALDFVPTPEKGRPADFTQGSVGNFVVRAEMDKPVVRVGDSALLTVEVTGSGNLRAVKAPSFRQPGGLKVSPVPTADLDELVVDKGGISGRRTFQFLLTPEREGSFELGRVSFPFFNSISGRYERSRTGIIRLEASGAGVESIADSRAGPGEALAIVEKSDLSEPPPRKATVMTPFYVVMTVPLAFFLFAEFVRRRRDHLANNSESLARRGALRRARQSLSRLAAAHGDEPEAFWATVDGVVHEFMAARFGVSASGMTHDEIRAFLAGTGAAPDAIDTLVAELESSAFGRFAPSAAMDTDRKAAVGRLCDCLALLDKAEGGR